jgi:hypothetical protein
MEKSKSGKAGNPASSKKSRNTAAFFVKNLQLNICSYEIIPIFDKA